jgi:SAM-dependent methyltransferase
MKTIEQIHLPGGDSQLRYTLGNVEIKEKKVLIIGSGSEVIAKEFLQNGANVVELIVEDYDSLLNSKLVLNETEAINPKMMEFEITDFSTDTFDIVYAQASISGSRRNKIIKEIKRILKNEGLLIVGEIVKLERLVPQFVQDMFDDSDLEPLFIDEITNYYKHRNFEIRDIMDYSKTLKDYYSTNLQKLSASVKELTDNEKSYYKKLLNQISHQSKAYLKQGADRFIGFCAIIAIVNKR